MSFFQVAIFMGLWFGFAWGTIMWFFAWKEHGIAGMFAVTVACMAGLLFGFSMATYYAYGRRKYRLPKWESLGEDRK